tara:strand:- start:328 stop:1128 length:801 start_codon:yes stop_codon:yes gene_type:complete
MSVESLDDNLTYLLVNKEEETNLNRSILWIHGVGLDHSIFNSQINYFKDKNPCVYFDLLGHGRTRHHKKEKIELEDFAVQIDQLLQYLNIDKVEAVIGFSLGSLIASYWISTRKKKTNKLVLLNSIFNRTPEEKSSALERFKIVQNEGIDSAAQIKRWFSTDFIEKRPNVSDSISKILETNVHHEFLKAYELFANFQNEMIDWDEITCKTLICTSKNDIGSTVRMSEEMHATIKNSSLTIIDNAAHLAIIEKADQVNQILEKFINS